jgi:hypothetical protein
VGGLSGRKVVFLVLGPRRIFLLPDEILHSVDTDLYGTDWGGFGNPPVSCVWRSYTFIFMHYRS